MSKKYKGNQTSYPFIPKSPNQVQDKEGQVNLSFI